MSQHGNRPNNERCSLSALVEQLREGCEAVARFQGGYTYHAEEVGIFRKFARQNHLFLKDWPLELSTAPWKEGNEHQVWFQPETSTYLKATWLEHFGMKVHHRHDEKSAASPIDYLERWMGSLLDSMAMGIGPKLDRPSHNLAFLLKSFPIFSPNSRSL